MVVRRLMLPQLSLVPVAPAADAAHEGFLSRVNANMGDVALASQETLAAGGTLVGQVPGVSPGVPVQLTPISEAFLAHVALERPLSYE